MPNPVSSSDTAHSPRLVRLERALNTRDIGGYPTSDGKTISYGKLYRSSELSYLTDADVETIRDVGIKVVVDFRGLKEAHDAPDRLPEGVEVVPSPIIRDDLDMSKIDEYLKRNNFPEPMYDVERVSSYGPYYRMLTLVNSYDDPDYVNAIVGYKPYFEQLVNRPADTPILAHCTGGRDRTGVAMFLLMHILGVPEEVALKDYLASNVFLQPERDNPDSVLFRKFRFSNIYTQPPTNRAFQKMAETLGTTAEAIYDSIILRREYPLYLKANIEKKYGSLLRYFEEEVGVGPQELAEIRGRHLEPKSPN